MPIIGGVEQICAGHYFKRNSSASDLYKAGLSVGSATMEDLRDCRGRPRTEGGPATTGDCVTCGLRVITKVGEGLRAMANRVNNGRSLLD